jgi:hypothetical protein
MNIHVLRPLFPLALAFSLIVASGCLDFSETERETVRAVGMTLVTKDRIHAGGLSVGLFGDPATSSLIIDEPTQCANLKNFLVHD